MNERNEILNLMEQLPHEERCFFLEFIRTGVEHCKLSEPGTAFDPEAILNAMLREGKIDQEKHDAKMAIIERWKEHEKGGQVAPVQQGAKSRARAAQASQGQGRKGKADK